MKWVIFSFLILPSVVFACPGCNADALDPEKGADYFLLLICFISLLVVPYYFIYRVIIKHRNVNKR